MLLSVRMHKEQCAIFQHKCFCLFPFEFRQYYLNIFCAWSPFTPRAAVASTMSLFLIANFLSHSTSFHSVVLWHQQKCHDIPRYTGFQRNFQDEEAILPPLQSTVLWIFCRNNDLGFFPHFFWSRRLICSRIANFSSYLFFQYLSIYSTQFLGFWKENCLIWECFKLKKIYVNIPWE